MHTTWLTVAVTACLLSQGAIAKKKEGLFTSDVLKCLVCRSVVDEIEGAIGKVDPNKKVETGTFRLDSSGQQTKRLIPYARSEQHLMEIVDTVCSNFEDYAQAKHKTTGEPMIIRFVTPQGSMNPLMGEVDMVPDEDLNTRLKFYCENIVEEYEDDIMKMFSTEQANPHNDLCAKRSNLCEEESTPPEEYEFEREDL